MTWLLGVLVLTGFWVSSALGQSQGCGLVWSDDTVRNKKMDSAPLDGRFTEQECREECEEQQGCLSIGYHRKSGTCVLSDFRRDQVPANQFKKARGYVYRERIEPAECPEIDTCLSSPCQNGGLCYPDRYGSGGYRCVGCDAQCGEVTDECSSSPCQNGGVCVDLRGGFVCVSCPRGWRGELCQIRNRLTVAVTTATSALHVNAGTTATLHLTIYGQLATSPVLAMAPPGGDFTTGSTMVFVYTIPQELGSIQSIRLQNYGEDAWLMETMVIEEEASGRKWTFLTWDPVPCRWLERSIPTTSCLSIDVPVNTEGGMSDEQRGLNYYGNNATLRGEYLPSGAKKSWIDFETSLPTGILRKFIIFIHNIFQAEQSDIRLQIWRPVSIPEYRYALQWEKIVTVNLETATGILHTYVLTEAEQLRVQQGDRIGWTNDLDLGTISLDYVEGHRTYFRNVADDDFPVVGNNYVFDNIYFPSIFSVGVEINPKPSTTPLGEFVNLGPPGQLVKTSETLSSTSVSDLIGCQEACEQLNECNSFIIGPEECTLMSLTAIKRSPQSGTDWNDEAVLYSLFY